MFDGVPGKESAHDQIAGISALRHCSLARQSDLMTHVGIAIDYNGGGIREL
jgi:hypothetical protein